MPKRKNDSFMLTTVPRTVTRMFFGFCDAGNDLVDLAVHVLQRFCRWHHIDVDHAPDLIMIHLGGSIDFLDIRHRLQGSVVGLILRPQGNLLEVVHAHVGDLLIEVLHGEHVVIPRPGVDPVAGRNHAVGSQRGNDVVYDLLGR